MPSLSTVKSSLNRAWTNLRGWRTDRKLLVIESDDWGATRMPGRKAFNALLAQGLRVDQSRYDSLDCLEDRSDLEALFEVLARHQDGHGRPAIMTFNTVMGNPDFAAIAEDGFARFHLQHFLESYRHYHSDCLESLWREAIAEQLIQPQFHAREHLNSPLWMRDLRSGLEQTRLAFEHQFYGLKTETSAPGRRSYLATYWPSQAEDVHCILDILRDGLKLFTETFGFSSRTFIGCNYVWPEQVEACLAANDVDFLQGQRAQLLPEPSLQWSRRSVAHYAGKQNRHGQRYGIRNVFFEPYKKPEADWSRKALAEVREAFLLRRPAVICSHRINFVAGMDRRHRDNTLRQYDQLLGQIRHRWPDVEFIASDELAAAMGRA